MSGTAANAPQAALLAGGLSLLIPLQSRINGELAAQVGSGLFPAWTTMVSGTVFLMLIVLSRPASRGGLADVVVAARTGTLPWWVFTGGIFGSLFLVSQSFAVPVVGVAVFTVAIVAGHTAGSLLADRFGLTGTGRRMITWQRIAASVLAVVAVGVGVSDRLGAGSATVALVLLSLVAGALLAPQQAFNGRVGMAARSPFVGALGNFVGGVLVTTIVLAIAMALGLRLEDPGAAPWWSYLGGVLGFLVIAGSAWTVPVLGVLVYALLSVFGQLAGAVLLDVVWPTAGTSVGWHLVAGAAMTFLAVLVAAAPGRRPRG